MRVHVLNATRRCCDQKNMGGSFQKPKAQTFIPNPTLLYSVPRFPPPPPPPPFPHRPALSPFEFHTSPPPPRTARAAVADARRGNAVPDPASPVPYRRPSSSPHATNPHLSARRRRELAAQAAIDGGKPGAADIDLDPKECQVADELQGVHPDPDPDGDGHALPWCQAGRCLCATVAAVKTIILIKVFISCFLLRT